MTAPPFVCFGIFNGNLICWHSATTWFNNPPPPPPHPNHFNLLCLRASRSIVYNWFICCLTLIMYARCVCGGGGWGVGVTCVRVCFCVWGLGFLIVSGLLLSTYSFSNVLYILVKLLQMPSVCRLYYNLKPEIKRKETTLYTKATLFFYKLKIYSPKAAKWTSFQTGK